MYLLFRKEAIEYKNSHGFGSAYLLIPRSYILFTLFLVLVTFAFGVMLFLGDYARKETVSGVLISNLGLVKIYAPRTGEVTSISLEDGQSIGTAQPMITISSPIHLSSGGNVRKQQKLLLHRQLDSIKEQIKNEQEMTKHRKEQQQSAIHDAKTNIWQLRNQLKITQELLAIRQIQYQTAISLADKGHLTGAAKKQSYQQLLQQQQNVGETKRQLLAQKSSLKQLQFELSQIPMLLKQTISYLKRQTEELNSQLLQFNSQGAEQLISSSQGRVTALQAHLGEQVQQGQLLMTVVPVNAELEAELYLPTRAAGFIEQNQTVRLRYAAFPYQRYGIFAGTVRQISKVVLTSQDLQASTALTEAVYKVNVILDSQSVNAFGQTHALQPGMQLEADIVLDTMSLLDWALMPIYAIKGRL